MHTNIFFLFEGVCLDSRHPDHRRAWKGGSEPHFLTPLPLDPLDRSRSADEFQIVQIMCVFTAKVARTSLRCNVFFTFAYPSHVQHLLLRAFWEDCLPERLSKVGVLAERGMKKSKKHHAIAPAHVHGPWSMDHGPWTWSMDHGPWTTVLGTWSMDHPGPWTMVHGPWSMDTGRSYGVMFF